MQRTLGECHFLLSFHKAAHDFVLTELYPGVCLGRYVQILLHLGVRALVPSLGDRISAHDGNANQRYDRDEDLNQYEMKGSRQGEQVRYECQGLGDLITSWSASTVVHEHKCRVRGQSKIQSAYDERDMIIRYEMFTLHTECSSTQGSGFRN
jgi:hypothetical protein